MKRLVRFVFLAGLVAGAVTALRALRRQQDPLPSPSEGPSGEPWPPLRNPSPAAPKRPSRSRPMTAESGDGARTKSPKSAPSKARPPKAKPAAPPAPAPKDRDTPAAKVTPEPGGVPVSDAEGPSGSSPWVEPAVDGECPDGYPIKAKMSSKIFHAPGQLNYGRTTPDRCYRSAEDAEADGLRAAKR